MAIYIVPEGIRQVTKCYYCDTVGDHLCEVGEKYRTAFMTLVNTKGDEYVFKKLSKLESYRKYDRKYPYDSTTKAKPIDDLFDLASGAVDPFDLFVAQESLDEFLALLTPKQQEDAQLYMQGYKPKDIAAMHGKEQSGAERWQKHNIKERLQEYL